MTQREFDQLQKSCLKSLNHLHEESRKTLNLLALARQFPGSVENRAALELQRQSEGEALADYQARVRELLTIVAARRPEGA
jgi:hypothetical protein